MTAVNHELHATEAYASRSYTYAPVCGRFFSGVLIVQLEHSAARVTRDVYAVCETPPDSPSSLYELERYFLVCKCGDASDDCDGLYLVTVPHTRLRPSSCRCFGFNRWGQCRHADAITDLVRREEI